MARYLLFRSNTFGQNMSTPQISIVIPTHHRAHLLERAIRSVRAQSPDVSVELLVISDAADPQTDAVCQKHLQTQDLYIRRNGKAGPSASRNLGLQHSQGHYVLFLDDDDALSPGYFEQLRHRPEYLGRLPLYTNCSVVHESRPVGGPRFISEQALDLSHQLNAAVYIKNQIPFSCFLWPRVLISALLFDTHMRAYEDWEFVLQFLARATPVHVPLLGPVIHTVPDDTTDRRGSSAPANDSRAILDYLYVYHRHPAPSDEIRAKRKEMMDMFAIVLPQEVY